MSLRLDNRAGSSVPGLVWHTRLRRILGHDSSIQGLSHFSSHTAEARWNFFSGSLLPVFMQGTVPEALLLPIVCGRVEDMIIRFETRSEDCH
jgi:hypothetical protein